MSNQLTIAQTVAIGDVSIYLADNDNAVGSLFGKRVAANGSALLIAIVTDALRWQNDGYPSDITLQGTANYLYWLCGYYAVKAYNLISGGGGGTVGPGNVGSNIYPFWITSANFELDGVSYNRPAIVNDTLELFVNEDNQRFSIQGPDTFEKTATGIIMRIPGFDANTQVWTIRIDRLISIT